MSDISSARRLPADAGGNQQEVAKSKLGMPPNLQGGEGAHEVTQGLNSQQAHHTAGFSAIAFPASEEASLATPALRRAFVVASRTTIDPSSRSRSSATMPGRSFPAFAIRLGTLSASAFPHIPSVTMKPPLIAKWLQRNWHDAAAIAGAAAISNCSQVHENQPLKRFGC